MSEANNKPSATAPQGGESIYDWRVLSGLLGILIASMLSGFSDRVIALGMPDLQGALGIGHDASTWLDSLYAAGELAAMPFSTWLAITFSLRRYHLILQAGLLSFALIIPFVHSFEWLLGLRLIQGLFAGALIPVLMMSALRFLPLPIRLHGLALYAMTATLAPNVAVWLTAFCTDTLRDWRWFYWAIIPPGILSMMLVAWGIPKMPLALSRIGQANWVGMAIGIPGLMLLALGVSQGVRLDWFNSSLVQALIAAGTGLTVLFLLTEWFHPAPFMRLQLLERRNLGLGFTVFFLLLLVLSSGVALPMSLLTHLQGFRIEQMSAMGLIIGLPQLVLGSAAALLLYQKWVDARHLFSLGLALIASGCLLDSRITADWMVDQFVVGQVLQAFGQPMAVVPLLFLGTSVVVPAEGQFVAGIINTMRAFGSVFGAALTGEIMAQRQRFHSDMLLNEVGHSQSQPLAAVDHGQIANWVSNQSFVMAGADLYLIFGIAALALIPLVLYLQYIPAPQIPKNSHS